MSAVSTDNFGARLVSARPLVGMWVSSASPYCAEIVAGSGLDWLLIDGEHAPNDLPTILAQLQAVAGYATTPVVRPPDGNPTFLKQLLDIGVQNLLMPMVETADQAKELVRAVRYPPAGIRGVGSGLARVSRWGRDARYLEGADGSITLVVQVESATALENIEAIARVDGVDGVFVGPADLAASLGHLGQQEHPEVVAAVSSAIAAVIASGKPVGVNAFAEPVARRYMDLGCRFVLVGADVTLLARGSEALASKFIAGS